jgi:hypothetical protein
MFPEIKNEHYHDMSFGDLDILRGKLADGSVSLDIKQSQLFLYLNNMNKWISFILKRAQEIQMLAIPVGIVFLFINWKVSVILFICFIVSVFFLSHLANACVYHQCKNDRVFLKFALAVGFVKIRNNN